MTYHNVDHTKEVIKNAQHLAVEENITEPEFTLLKTAALFHESGMLETYKGHEDISCQMAQKWLPQFEYSNDEIATNL